jgi:hypothetical protein
MKRQGFGKTRHLLIWLVAGILSSLVALAQNGAPPSIAEQLEARYEPAKLAYQSGQVTITEPGTLLVIQQAGIQGFPPSSFAMAPAVFKDGALRGPGKGSVFGSRMLDVVGHAGAQSSGGDARPLTVGEKVYVSKIDVNLKKDSIGLRIIECDTCNGVSQPSSYKADVIFQFSKGYLAGGNVADIEDTIAKVFSIDNAVDAQQNQAAQGAQAQGAQDQGQAQAQPASIQLGETPEQVQAALGQPDKTADLGAKKIWVYKDLKVTFVGDKVSDVQ